MRWSLQCLLLCLLYLLYRLLLCLLCGLFLCLLYGLYTKLATLKVKAALANLNTTASASSIS
jgi:hypothetical protein